MFMADRIMTGIVMAYLGMVYIVTARTVVVYVIMTYVVIVNTVIANTIVADITMADTVTTYRVIGMRYRTIGRWGMRARNDPCSLPPHRVLWSRLPQAPGRRSL